MPPKRGGGDTNKSGPSRDNQGKTQHQPATTNDTQTLKNTPSTSLNQSKFTISPLILEGVKLNKVELNDIIKQHFTDIKIHDIQLARSGVFTIFATDVTSFNRLLNDFTKTLVAKGQSSANLFVPRSIQKIQDTEKVAFVKRVDLEIPENRIVDSLKEVGFTVENVTRLTNKEKSFPTRTIKIIFSDLQNRNTFVQTGLQIDSMHFVAEPAMQNIKPVQCYICLKYNHIAKYCKTKQQQCVRCGENHHGDQCPNSQLGPKCCNCKGDHLANSFECPTYKEHERKIQKMINQYSSTNKQTATTLVPVLYNNDEFPSLPNGKSSQQELFQKKMIDEIINVLTSKIEKIIEDTTNKIFNIIHQKINRLEKALSSRKHLLNEEATESEAEDDDEIQMVDDTSPPATSTQTTSNTPATAPPASNTTSTPTPTPTQSNETATKTARKQKQKTAKRNRSPNSSIESTQTENKDLKTN